jgi:hypothetical protein
MLPLLLLKEVLKEGGGIKARVTACPLLATTLSGAAEMRNAPDAAAVKWGAEEKG